MRHKPSRIDGISVESAAQLIVHAAFGHLAKGKDYHFGGFGDLLPPAVPQEKVKGGGPGKFGSSAKSAETRIKCPAKLKKSGFGDPSVDPPAAIYSNHVFQLLKDFIPGFDDLVTIVLPRRRQLLENLTKTGASPAAVGRVIRASVERLQVGS